MEPKRKPSPAIQNKSRGRNKEERTSSRNKRLKMEDTTNLQKLEDLEYDAITFGEKFKFYGLLEVIAAIDRLTDAIKNAKNDPEKL
jgi:hypothetical protein